MRSRRVVNRDPRWMDAKYAGNCAGCGQKFAAGSRIAYFPIGKQAFYGGCGEAEMAAFRAHAEDERVYHSGAY